MTLPTRHLARRPSGPWSRGAALSLFLCCAQLAAAQGLRDPTLAPPPASPASPTAAAASGPTAREQKTLALVSGPLTLIERDGRLHVALEGRLYAEGQRFGQIRIERVRESEVWFRDGTALYKMSRFPGIRRSSAVPPADLPAEQPRLPSSLSLR